MAHAATLPSSLDAWRSYSSAATLKLAQQASDAAVERAVAMVVEAGATPALQALLQRSPVPPLQGSMLAAATFDRPQALPALLAAGASATELEPGTLATPLHRAAESSASVDIVRALLEHGAVVDARDALQRTPLHYAVAAGAVSCVAALLKAGADPAAVDDIGRSPSELAETLHAVAADGGAARAWVDPPSAAAIAAIFRDGLAAIKARPDDDFMQPPRLPPPELPAVDPAGDSGGGGVGVNANADAIAAILAAAAAAAASPPPAASGSASLPALASPGSVPPPLALALIHTDEAEVGGDDGSSAIGVTRVTRSTRDSTGTGGSYFYGDEGGGGDAAGHTDRATGLVDDSRDSLGAAWDEDLSGDNFAMAASAVVGTAPSPATARPLLLTPRAVAAAAAAAAAGGGAGDAIAASDVETLVDLLLAKFHGSVEQGLVTDYSQIYAVLDSAGDGHCSAGDLASGVLEMGIAIDPALLPDLLEWMTGRPGAETVSPQEFVAFCTSGGGV